ncbi:MAG: SpoIIE family protein phosphatase [Clostridia bacterium]
MDDQFEQSGIMQKLEIIWSCIIKKISIKNIIFVILSIVMSNMTFMGEFSPFSYVLFGVASVFNVPLLLVLIFSIIGMAINSITVVAIIKLLAFFVLFTFITALINIEGISRRYSVFLKFIISVVTVELIANFLTSTLLINFFEIFSGLIIVAILYFVFTTGIYVLINFSKEYIYSKEETIAMITVIALALSVIENINIFSFSLYNILLFVMILIFGWKKGALPGCSAGLVVGLFLTGMVNVNMTFVVLLAFSGFIAGILSKFGKVAVVLGFIIGNIYISYYASGFSELTLRASEILIASISLLFLPKSIELKIASLFNKNNTLKKPYENILDSASSLKSKIGAVSEVFENLASITIENTPEYAKETRDVIRKYIEDYVENSCMDCADRHSCISSKNLVATVDYIASKLENNEYIDSNMLKYNCSFSDKLITDITEVYNSMKLMRLLKEKEHENSVKLSKQYREVSKILSNVAKEFKTIPIIKSKVQQKLRDELKFYGYVIYEDEYLEESDDIEYTFVTDILNNIDKQKKEIIELSSNVLEKNMTIKLILNSSKKEKSKIKIISNPKYEIKTNIVSFNKDLEEISGDSYISMELKDMKHLVAISDGAGSGKAASKSSQAVINMLEKLLEGGFDQNKSFEIINSALKLKSDESAFATLDIVIIDKKTANAEFIKIGAAPTYIYDNLKVDAITSSNIALGLVEDTDYIPIAKQLMPGSIVVQISDGVITDEMDKNSNYITKYLQNLDNSKNAKIISEEISKLVLKENKNILKDDVTIMVTKVC